MRKIAILIFLGVCFSSSAVQAADSASAKPKIRVGLFTTTEPVTVFTNSTAKLKSDGATLATIPGNTTVTFIYEPAARLYHASVAGTTHTSSAAIVLKPSQPSSITTISSYQNAPGWDASLNDNEFYGSIEVKAGLEGKVWVVNELGIENYVKGVAEASNGNPQAYLKTLYTAARTYAYFHYTHPTKHAGEPYLLDTTANDQVYRGYGLTKRSPNIVTAVNATAGTIVMYDGAVAITPYFSQSDGRTRSFEEVWNADYPYLQSVADPCCTEDVVLGHGVGLSAKGARYFATEQHWHWKEILQYYYTGISLEKIW